MQKVKSEKTRRNDKNSFFYNRKTKKSHKFAIKKERT